MSRRYRIHEFAGLSGLTVKTLHHYDRLGLLTPTRTDAGYRLYAEADLERLEQIIAEIPGILAEAGAGHLEANQPGCTTWRAVGGVAGTLS